MSDVMIFENTKFGQIRTIEIEGEIYFVGNDVAKALGYSNPKNAVKRHCAAALKQGVRSNMGVKADGSALMQKIHMNVIPEGDLYRLAVSSKLPSAKEFNKWVFDEVLPSIRKDGGYQKLTQQGAPIVTPALDKLIKLRELAVKEANILLRVAAQKHTPQGMRRKLEQKAASIIMQEATNKNITKGLLS